MSCDTEDFAFLGPGIPLYFEFIKGSVIILISLMLTSGLFNIYTNLFLGNDCLDEIILDNSKCKRNIFTILSFGNKKSNASLT